MFGLRGFGNGFWMCVQFLGHTLFIYQYTILPHLTDLKVNFDYKIIAAFQKDLP